MSEPSPTRRGQIATPAAVATACEELFRAGENITEAAVRGILGGGSTPVIYKHIRAWETMHRDRFFALEAQAEEVSTSAPENVPQELWEALLPAWKRVEAQAAQTASNALQADRERLTEQQAALAADREALNAESVAVVARDEAWREERSNWSAQIADLNTSLANRDEQVRQLKAAGAELADENQRITAAKDALSLQLNAAQETLKDAERRHQADQDRWAKQIDVVRQEAKAIADRLSDDLNEANRLLRAKTDSHIDLRLELTRSEAALSAAQLQISELEQLQIDRGGLARQRVRQRLRAHGMSRAGMTLRDRAAKT